MKTEPPQTLSLSAPETEIAKAFCEWKQTEWGYYDAGCASTFEFTAGGPLKAEFKFCPYCGKPIEEVKQ